MDIKLLSKMIRVLMLDNDSVTLPGLGSFVAVQMPASFSDRGFTINPPYRKLGFTTQPGTDTMLLDMYAASNSIDSDQARVILQKFINGIKEQLRSDGSVDFPELGRLKVTRDEALLFICDPELDIFPQGLGLEPISLRFKPSTPTEQESLDESQDQIIQEPQPQSSPDQEKPRKKSRGGRIILVFLIIIAIAVGLFFYAAKYQPDLLDSILYTREELDILNKVL